MANFDAHAKKWMRTRNESINRLRQLADELDLMQERVNITNIAGTSTSITTGIGSIVCFGLAAVTGGISIIPGIVLAAVGGGGAVTSVGAFVGKYAHEKHILKNVKKSLNNDRDLSESLNTAFATRIKGRTFARGGIGSARLVAGGIDLGAGIVSNVKSGAKATARTVSQVAGAVGFVFDLVLLPLDIYILVDTSIDVHRGSTHEAAVKVRDVAAKLEEERNDFQEIFNDY